MFTNKRAQYCYTPKNIKTMPKTPKTPTSKQAILMVLKPINGDNIATKIMPAKLLSNSFGIARILQPHNHKINAKMAIPTKNIKKYS
ncbi:MAG: hypothetical protein RR454_01685 [Clostridia bacterium]